MSSNEIVQSSANQPAAAVPAPARRGGLARLLKRHRILLSIASFIVLMLVWEIGGAGGNPLLTSHPSAIYLSLVGQIANGELPTAFMESLKPLFLGYGIAVVVGVPIGLMLGRYWAPEAAFGFYFIGLDATPLVAFMPLFILWFGLDLMVKVVVVACFSVTPIIINTWMGVRGVPKTLIELGKAFVASEPYIMRKIVLPYALPSIVTGLRLGIGRAIIATAVAELFTALSGLGGLLLVRSEDYDTAGTFVPALVFMAMGITMTSIIGLIERRIAPWHKEISAGHE